MSYLGRIRFNSQLCGKAECGLKQVGAPPRASVLCLYGDDSQTPILTSFVSLVCKVFRVGSVS